MAARREVGRARRHQDERAERAARRRVRDAKIALGERGPAWWEPIGPTAVEERLRSTILALAHKRGADSSICPSDAARVVGGRDGDWRSLMEAARSVAAELARSGRVRLTVAHHVVDPDALPSGPIRISLTPDH